MQDWNDLRFFLSVADQGSTMAASAACHTSQSTVFRRIGALEKALGLQLFDRRPSGYALTQAGAALLAHARQVEAAVEAFSAAAGKETRRQTTVIRFSAPDVAMDYIVQGTIAAFRSRHPDVGIELIASDRKLDLAAGEADVALRANPIASDSELFGRFAGHDRPRLCASRAYAAQHPLPGTNADMAAHSFISLTSALAGLLGPWVAANVPPERILVQPGNIASTLTAVRSGLGLAVLPQFFCDRDADLVAAPLQLPLQTFELWIVAHARSRKSPPVRTFMDLVAKYMEATSRPPEPAG